MPKKHRLAYPNLTLDISRCFLFHNAGMNRIQFDEVLINLPMTSHVGRWPHWLSHVFFGGSWNHQPLSWAKTWSRAEIPSSWGLIYVDFHYFGWFEGLFSEGQARQALCPPHRPWQSASSSMTAEFRGMGQHYFLGMNWWKTYGASPKMREVAVMWYTQ